MREPRCSFRRSFHDVGAAWPLATAFVLLLVLLAAIGRAMLQATRGHLVYPLDDTYIQMAIAKTLAAHGVWGVTRYEFSSAGSSLLWPWVMAAYDRVIGSGERGPLMLNAASAVLLVTLAYVVLRRHMSNRVVQAMTLGLMIVATPVPVLVLEGMEHTLECVAVLGLTILGVRLCLAADDGERRRMFGLTLVAAPLVVAIRYDAASVLVPVLALILVTRGWRPAVAAAVGGAIPALVFAAIAWRHGWPVLPASVLLKQRLGNIDPLSWDGFIDFVGNGALSALVDTPALFVLVVAAVGLAAFAPQSPETVLERESRFLLLVFIGGAMVHAQFGRLGELYRYEGYLIALGIVAVACALAHRAPLAWPRIATFQRLAAIILAVLILQPLVRRGFHASREVVAYARNTYFHQYQWGQFFHRHPPDGGLLLTDHLGAIAYFSDIPIVDASGLATLQLLALVRAGTVDRNLEHRIAEAHGARVSLRYDSSSPAPGWRCVAGWQSTANLPIDEIPTWLFAADAMAAADLERDLKAFAADDSEHVVKLRFADDRGHCAADR